MYGGTPIDRIESIHKRLRSVTSHEHLRHLAKENNDDELDRVNKFKPELEKVTHFKLIRTVNTHKDKTAGMSSHNSFSL